MNKIYAIAREEAALRSKREKLRLEAELAEVEAEERVLQDFDENDREITHITRIREHTNSDVSGSESPMRLNTEAPKISLKSLMPKQDIAKFDGDHTKYLRFIRSFDDVFSSQLTNNKERLRYLDLYTTERPNEIVAACLHLDASEGYKQARKLLEERYGPHMVDECHQISQMGPEEKPGAIRELGLCFGCLRSGHRSQYYRNRKGCNICNGNHPTLLHRQQEVEVVESEHSNRALVVQEECSHEKIAMFRAVSSIGTGMSVLRIRIRSREGREVLTKDFLDNGSSTCFVSEALMQTLGCTERQDIKVNLETINGIQEVSCSLV
ncbi:uncharacterized protein [Palaemon carinicauda]|uniref:uncharacterized protein n=1 Tax=Palaemon carinicauda TaxID=392227 RepID=UPI0035B60E68